MEETLSGHVAREFGSLPPSPVLPIPAQFQQGFRGAALWLAEVACSAARGEHVVCRLQTHRGYRGRNQHDAPWLDEESSGGIGTRHYLAVCTALHYSA